MQRVLRADLHGIRFILALRHMQIWRIVDIDSTKQHNTLWPTRILSDRAKCQNPKYYSECKCCDSGMIGILFPSRWPPLTSCYAERSIIIIIMYHSGWDFPKFRFDYAVRTRTYRNEDTYWKYLRSTGSHSRGAEWIPRPCCDTQSDPTCRASVVYQTWALRIRLIGGEMNTWKGTPYNSPTGTSCHTRIYRSSCHVRQKDAITPPW